MHQKSPNSPVYYFSPRQKTGITQPSNLNGRLLINRIPEKLEAYEDTNTRGQKAQAAFSLDQTNGKVVFKPGVLNQATAIQSL